MKISARVVNHPKLIPISEMTPGQVFCLSETMDSIVSGDPVVYKRIVPDDKSDLAGKICAVDLSGKPIRMLDGNRLGFPVMLCSAHKQECVEKLLKDCSPGDIFLDDGAERMIVENPKRAVNGDVYAINQDGCPSTFNGDRLMRVYRNPLWEISLSMGS